MSSYASKEMNIMGARAFIESLNRQDGRSTKNSTVLYAVLGKSSDWPNEPTANLAQETVKNKHYDFDLRDLDKLLLCLVNPYKILLAAQKT